MKELLKHIIFDQHEKDISQMIERDIDLRLVLTEGLILTDDETEEVTIDNKKIQIIPIWKWLLKE